MPFTKEYKKLMLIGRGSFAAVYKVRHNALGYVRAIKISNEMVDSENDRSYKSFLNECKLLLKIGNGSHPNIVHIYQPRLINNHALVEMDYVDGRTLTDWLRDNSFVPFSEFKRFALSITSAIGYCHADLYKFLLDPDEDELEPDPDDGSRYLISPEKEKELQAKYCVNHNDLHSNNIMRRNYDGEYILLDFGLAIQGEHCVKSSSRADGAYEYSSPEKLDGKEITSASDVYSLGILLYEMLTGKVPFVMGTGGSMADISRIYDRQLHERPAPIEPLRRMAYNKKHPGQPYSKDYPDALDDIIMKCLEKDPANRYHDAKQLHLALETVLSGQEATPLHPATGAVSSTKSLSTPDMILSDSRMARHKVIDQESLDMLSGTTSAEWYHDNCFIIPSGYRLPNPSELASVNPLLRIPDVAAMVWTDTSMACDTKDEKYFLAIKR